MTAYKKQKQGSASRIIGKAREKGLRRSAKLGLNISGSLAKNKVNPRHSKRYVFIGHHMDNTGAPVVLMQIIEEYAMKYGGKNVRLVTSHVAPNHKNRLKQLGVKIDKAALAFGRRLIKLQLNLRKDDFVLINTIATYENYRDFIFHELETNNLDRAYWFIHEDKAQIPGINSNFTRTKNIKQINKLLSKDKLKIVTPSNRTQADYNKIFSSTKVTSMPLLVDVPEKYCKPKTATDFKTINFFLSGHAGDGRKGQLIAIAALNDFKTRYYQDNPELYRDYTLNLVSISDDYISQQVKWIGESLLGDRIVIHPQVPRENALELAAKCNAVICCSLNETFGLYVAEGMFMGHVVLRNNSAGMEEQLQEGVNGYYIDHHDIHKFADVVEKILNRDETTDDELKLMGLASQNIIKQYSQSTYLEKISGL